MNFRTIQYILGGMLAAVLVVLLLLGRTGPARLRQANQALRQQLAQGAELHQKHLRLSNHLATASHETSLSDEQFRELLRLRGEVGRLRQERQEPVAAQAGGGRAGGLPGRGAEAADASQAPERFTPESLAFAGYGEPRAALQSHFWASLNAARNRDGKAFLEALTPEERARWLAAHKTEDRVADQLARNCEGISGFRILKEQPVSDEEVLFTVYVEGKGLGTRMRMKRIGTEWKFDRQLGLN